jgi:hypothetical protein
LRALASDLIIEIRRLDQRMARDNRRDHAAVAARGTN